MKPFALIVGTAILGIGLYLAENKITAYEGTSSQTCGSVFSPKADAATQRDQLGAISGPRSNFGSACHDKLDSRKTISFVLIGLGAAVLVGSFFVPGRRRE